MPRFSERFGHRPARDTLQTDSIDSDLKVALWNVLEVKLWEDWRQSNLAYNSAADTFFKLGYLFHFHWSLDSYSGYGPDEIERIKKTVFVEGEWYDVYDYFEFCVANYPDEYERPAFVRFVNQFLEMHASAYRCVGGKFIRVIDDVEIDAIDEAANQPIVGVEEHMKSAIVLLAKKPVPDYPNSIKESISAVEALVRLVGGKPKATLGDALKSVKPELGLHPALLGGISKLYGYSSDQGGIRHARSDGDAVGAEDAIYMLVSCSAFINYVVEKARKADLDLGAEKGA